MARNFFNADEVLELIFGNGSDLEDEGSEDEPSDQSESEFGNFDELPSGNDSFTEGLVQPPPPCDRSSRLISDQTDESGSSCVQLTFVSESSTRTVVHVQPAMPAAVNLAVPVRPAARRPPVNNNFDWSNFHGIEQNPNSQKAFVGYTGPSREAVTAQSVVDHFKLFLDIGTVNSLCDETNRYAVQNHVGGFQNVVVEEMMAFISLNIAMGIVNTSDIKDFWSTDPILSHPWFPSIMSRDRFLQILQCLHVNNNDNDTGNDKLFKLRPFLDHVVRQCKRLYKPNREVSVDEQMIGTKCRIGFRQYMPLKPTHKWGIKVWVMADSVTGYCCNLQIYTGKEGGNAEQGLASRVVKDLMDDYQGLGHHLYVDNFYTSPQLFKDLLDAGTLACGTVRNNRKGFPVALRQNLERNESAFLKSNLTEGFMTAVHWKDKRDVFALSTIHGNAVADDLPHKPEIICEYNKFMGGVDHNDQLLVYFAVGRKTMKWWKRVFWRLIDIALVDCYLLYKLKPGNASVSQKQFRLELCHSLVQPLLTLRENPGARAVRGPGRPPAPNARLLGKHFGQRADKRRRCKVCAYKKNARGQLRQTKTNFFCAKCDVHLCEHPCFQEWHTRSRLK